MGIDADRRRIAYSVVGGRFSVHGSSIQIVPASDRARLFWICDFLPDSAAPIVEGLMERGGDALVTAVSALAGTATLRPR